MPKREKLDALFRLLKEMTLCVRKVTTDPFTRWMEQIEKMLMTAFVVTMTLLVIVVVWYRLTSSPPFHGVHESINAIYLIGMLWAALYLLAAIIYIASMLWRHRHERFAAILKPLEKDLTGDVDFLARLQDFDKPTLTYGLVQYRHHYAASDGRIAMLAGDIRKIGLFPALMAAAVAAAALLKESSSNPFLWAPLVLACCFYSVSVIVTGQRERASQVIALLEYAINDAGWPTQMRSARAPGTRSPLQAQGNKDPLLEPTV